MVSMRFYLCAHRYRTAQASIRKVRRLQFCVYTQLTLSENQGWRAWMPSFLSASTPAPPKDAAPPTAAIVNVGVYVACLNVRLTSMPSNSDDFYVAGRKKKYVQALPMVQLAMRGAAMELVASPASGLLVDVGVQYAAVECTAQSPSLQQRTILQLGKSREALSYLYGSLFHASPHAEDGT